MSRTFVRAIRIGPSQCWEGAGNPSLAPTPKDFNNPSAQAHAAYPAFEKPPQYSFGATCTGACSAMTLPPCEH